MWFWSVQGCHPHRNGVESAERRFLGVLSLGVAGGEVSAERGVGLRFGLFPAACYALRASGSCRIREGVPGNQRRDGTAGCTAGGRRSGSCSLDSPPLDMALDGQKDTVADRGKSDAGKYKGNDVDREDRDEIGVQKLGKVLWCYAFHRCSPLEVKFLTSTGAGLNTLHQLRGFIPC